MNAQFRASFTRRWHTNPDLAQTVDTLAGHGGRVARIILKLWPDSNMALLQWALVHDDGESVTGDIPFPAKVGDSEAEREALASIWPDLPPLSVGDQLRLIFADRLDAYMWAKHHAPHALDGDGWPACRAWLVQHAQALVVDVSL